MELHDYFETTDREVIDSMRRKKGPKYQECDSGKHVVYFRVDRVRKLVGE